MPPLGRAVMSRYGLRHGWSDGSRADGGASGTARPRAGSSSSVPAVLSSGSLLVPGRHTVAVRQQCEPFERTHYSACSDG